MGIMKTNKLQFWHGLTQCNIADQSESWNPNPALWLVPNTVQSRFSDIKFSDNLRFSDYFSKTIFNLLHKIIHFSDIMRFSDSFRGD